MSNNLAIQTQHNEFKNSITNVDKIIRIDMCAIQHQVLTGTLHKLASTVAKSDKDSLQDFQAISFLHDAQDELIGFMIDHKSDSIFDIYKKLKFWEEAALATIGENDLTLADKLIAKIIEEMRVLLPTFG